MYVTAILAAAGRGARLGAGMPKQLLTVGGRMILERSVGLFLAHPDVAEIVVVLPAEIAADPPSFLRTAAKPVRIVAGGARRQDSVRNGFDAASARAEVLVVHDAARPFASGRLISETIAAAAESGAAVAAVAARDTVKRVTQGGPDRRPRGDGAPPERGGFQSRAEGEGGRGDRGWTSAPDGGPRIVQTLPREEIYLAQTPQAFRRDVLRDALALGAGGLEATDEATLAERAGHVVRVVDGEQTNIKITTAADLPIAEALARAVGVLPIGESSAGRVGTGYDLHRLVPGRRLVVGGVELPSDRGALGHSDADVVCHAIIDAILGAAALGDIGRHFPDTEAQWKDASSVDLLARAVQTIAGEGLEVGNVDVTIVLETPKIKDHIDAMRRTLAAALGIDAASVSVKGKTNEGMDAIGRGEAIAAHAVALLRAASPSAQGLDPKTQRRTP
jgi:2-C-methyl-D-erythritol 4-phosphate cytidylyltransferase/2-C-methyl-D-erythritol 2,4-cyclodiphosphate synthase